MTVAAVCVLLELLHGLPTPGGGDDNKFGMYKACPENCSNHGKCFRGRCRCADGWRGLDCGVPDCPNSCSYHGYCGMDGTCHCYIGYSGAECSQLTCPKNCSNHGVCTHNLCHCHEGYAGFDCSEQACPMDCMGRGRCRKGVCYCPPGFTGRGCEKPTCRYDCHERGYCINGTTCECIDREWMGDDCNTHITTVECPRNCSEHGCCTEQPGSGTKKCRCDLGWHGLDCGEPDILECPNNCSGTGECVNGTCYCFPGWGGDNCEFPPPCPGDCSGHGECDEDNKCSCKFGFTGDTCSESAGCPNDCNYPQGKCYNWQCYCKGGFKGVGCEQRTCWPPCKHGMCDMEFLMCRCEEGWFGIDCTKTGDVVNNYELGDKLPEMNEDGTYGKPEE